MGGGTLTLPYTEVMTAPSSRTKNRLATVAVLAAASMTVATANSLAATAGPEIGSKVPSFEAIDQSGEARDFESLTGENGLLLLFFRSADW